MEYINKKVLIGLSAGINSAAVLCWLGTLPQEERPQEVHLYYAHFEEHSPDSLPFVLAQVEWAKGQFQTVVYKQTDNSILAFFEKSKAIFHPANSGCSRLLKIIPMHEYFINSGLDVDLIGYVKEEKRRATKLREKYADSSSHKHFPILTEGNEWCFEIVKKNIGWYPAIYDLIWDDAGLSTFLLSKMHLLDDYTIGQINKKIRNKERVFKHNNCLPCKNMTIIEMLTVEYFFLTYWKGAQALSDRLKKYWGRNADDYYTTFGKQDYEPQKCETCSFD